MITLVDCLREEKIEVPSLHVSPNDPRRQHLMHKIAEWFLRVIDQQGGAIRQYEAACLNREINTVEGEPFPERFVTHNPILEKMMRERHICQQRLSYVY